MVASRIFAIGLGVFVALGASACVESSHANTAVSQTSLTSADSTIVAMTLPPGYGEVPAPPLVFTPLEKETEEAKNYPLPVMETSREWAVRYPFPAKLLAEWTREHPQSAEALARWETEQPDHVRVLVLWAVTNRYEGVDSFMMRRGGWNDLISIRDNDATAVADLLHLCRSSPKAVEELVLHSPGFAAAIALQPIALRR